MKCKFLNPILSFLCATLFVVSVHAEHLPIRIYTSADGLGSSFIDHLLRDSRGFMWFATRDGLSRFDGSQFVTYRVGEKNSPPGVEGIFETSGGTYWVSTSAGMFRFKANTLSLPQKATEGRTFLNVEFVSARRGEVYEDRSGTTWFASDGLFRLSEKDGKFDFEPVELPLAISPNRSLTIARMMNAPDGSLWLVTNSGVVRRLPDGRLVQYEYDSSFRVGAIALTVQKSGLVWVGWGKDMYIINPEPVDSVPQSSSIQVRPLVANSSLQIQPGKEVKMPQAGNILQLSKTSFDGLTIRMLTSLDGAVWISSNNELLNFAGQRFVAYGPEQGLPAGMAEMAEDSAGNLWITGRTALVRLDRKGFITYGQADGLNSRAIYSINEASDGTLFFANGDYYLSSFDGKKFLTTRPALDPDARALWTSRYAFLSKQHEWWILTNTKLYRFTEHNLNKNLHDQ